LRGSLRSRRGIGAMSRAPEATKVGVAKMIAELVAMRF
jgi:hypothetical protein